MTETLIIWLVIVLIGSVIYLRRKGASPKQRSRFLIAAALIFAVVGTPFAYFAAHGLFSAYMTQQSILFLVVPPLLISGIPSAWVRPLLWKPGVKKVFALLTYPWLTAIFFNVGFSFFLLPFFFRSVHGHPFYSGLCTLILFIAAMLMWWSILSPLSELNPLSEVQRIFYIFITAIMLTPIAFLMLFANHVLYPAYANTPQAFSYLNAMYDQQIAGGILKSFQLTSYGIELGIIIFGWVKSEKERGKGGKVISFKRADDR